MFEAKTDAQLCGLSSGGSAEAFTELVRRTQGAVCAVTYAATGRHDISEDLAQETYLVAWRKLRERTLDEPDKVAGWLVGIGRNLARKTFREQPSEPLERAEDLVDEQGTIEDAAAEQQRRDRVWELLSELPERYREVMVLYYREEQSTPRVGELLGITVSAAEQRLSRGRKMLRAKVERALREELGRTRPTAAFTDRVAAALPLGALAPVATPTASRLDTFAKAISMKTLALTSAAIVTTLAVGYVALDRSEDEEVAASSVAPTPPRTTPMTLRSEAPSETSLVSGIVVEADADEPIAGAMITLVQPGRGIVTLPSPGGSPQPAVVRSDAEGSWSLEGLPPGRYVAIASAPGLLSATLPPFQVSAGDAIDSLKFELASGGVSLSGVVSDVGGGPVAGATVRAKGPSGFPASAITDDDGRYALQLPHGVYELSVWDAGYQDVDKRVSVEGAGAQADFELVPAATIAGRVIDRDSGAPVAGAVISYGKLVRYGRGFSSEQSDPEDAVVTDEHGRFVLQRLAPAEYSLFANADHRATRAPARIELGIADQVQDVTIAVDPAFNATGRVFFEGNPSEGIAGARVSTLSRDETVRAFTGSDGSFTLEGLRPGTYPLMVEGDGAIPSMLKVTVTVDDADQDEVEIPLEAGTELSGRIEPPGIAEVRLALRESSGGIEIMLKSGKVGHAKVTSAADGTFTLPAAPRGSWKLVAEATDGSIGEVEVEVGETATTGVRVQMAPRPAIRGRVVDVDGVPLRQVTVRLEDAQNDRRAMFGAKTTTTDGDGTFALVGLDPGQFTLSVRDHRDVPFPREGQDLDDPGQPVTIDGSALDEVELRVQPPTERIEGRVLDPEGAPHADAWVRLNPTGESMLAGRTSVAVTDDEGHFSFDALAKGSYGIDVRSNRGDAVVEASDVMTGEALDLTLEALGTIHGTVTLDGDPVEAFSVRADGMPPRTFYAEGGRFELPLMKPGHPLVTITAADGGNGRHVTVTGGETTDVAFDLGGWATIEGRAVDEDGNPVAGLVVGASSTGGVREDRGSFAAAFSDEGRVVTGPDGRFSYDGVGAGRGELSLRDPDMGYSSGEHRGGSLFYVAPREVVNVGTVRVLDGAFVPWKERGTLAMSAWAKYDRPSTDGTAEPLDEPTGEAKLFVTRVDDGGPAASAGLTRGTQILSIDGESVDTLGASTVAGRLRPERLEVGQVVRLEVSDAGGERRTVELRATKD